MPLSSQLGAANSQLGNIQLGGYPQTTAITASFSDTITFSETITGHNLTVSMSDMVTFSDLITGHTNLLGDTLTFSDLLSTDNELNVILSDTVTFSDHATLVYEVELNDSITFVEGMDYIVEKDGSWTDTLTFLDELLSEIIVNKSVWDTLELLETIHPLFVRLRSLSDTVTLTDVFAGYVGRNFNDTLTFADAMTAFVTKVFRDTLDFGEVWSRQMTYNRPIADQLVLYDSITTTHVTRHIFTEAVTFVESMTGYREILMTPDILNFTDSMTAVNTIPVHDTLTFTEQLPISKVTHHTRSEVLTFNDNSETSAAWRANIVVTKQLEDVIEFVDIMLGLRAHVASMSDTLNLTDEALREVHVVSLSDTLTFVDSLSQDMVWHKNWHDALPFSDAISENTTSHLVWNDLLVFAEGFQVKYKGSRPTDESIREVIPVYPTIPDGATGYIPSVIWEGVTRIRPQVVFIGHSTSIVLPPPEFNDFDANEGKIAVQRSMTSRFRVYVKKAEREKRNWKFVIPRYKAEEFKAFLLAEINNELRITDWEGNHWNAKILSDSVDFTESRRWEPCGNATEVTIEIVGNRYA